MAPHSQELEPPINPGRFIVLTAIATALPSTELSSRTKGLLSKELGRTELHQHHLLRFFDYRFRSGTSVSSRRDYSVIPQAALDVILAASESASFVGKLVGLERAEWILRRMNPGQLGFFAASDDALVGSKDQAWAAIALAASRRLLHSGSTIARALLSIQRYDAPWGYASALGLVAAGVLSLAPEMTLSVFHINATGASPDPGARETTFALRLLGTIVLAAWGQSLGARSLRVLRGWSR